MASTDDVRNASRNFYTALNRMPNGDAGPMTEIWLQSADVSAMQSADVSAMHPIGGRHLGFDDVKGSFEQVSKLASDGKIELRDQLIRVSGDMAYEIGTEHGRFTLAGQQVAVDHRVTNIYQREGGAWKMIHHHTGTSPGMLDVISGL